jgi:hypothetical protein
MIQLIAYEQSTETPYYLDIDSDEDISLNFSVSEIKDFSTRKSSSSNSFTLPFTNINNQFFAGLYNVNLATGTFDIYQKTNCQLLVDSLAQIQGYLYIESINLTTETYSVVIIGETGNLIDELGEKKLQDLDQTWQNTFTHALTYDNIVNSWDDNITYTGGATDKSVIKYPFINWGINNKIWTLGGNNTNDIIETTGAIVEEEFKPAMKVATIFDRVFAEAGYSYDSQFFSTSGFNIYDTYLTLAPQHSVVKYRVANQAFRAVMSSNQVLALSQDYTLQFDNDSTGQGFDAGGNYDNTTYSYTAPKEGTYAFRDSIILQELAGEDVDFSFSIAVNGIPYGGTQTYLINNDTLTYNLTHFVNLNAADVVTFIITIVSVANPTSFRVNSGSYFQLIRQPNTPVGESIYIQDNMPDESQIDFLKSFFEHFNMFVEPKQDNPKELIIDPYPIYMDRGVELDWTKKIDLSKEVQIIPTTNFRKSKLIWNWKEDKNYLDTYRRDFSKKPYGGFEYEDKSELTTGEFKNSTIFSTPTNRLINTSGTTQIYELCVMDLTARQSDGSVAVLKGNPRIFFFKKKDLGSNNFIRLYDQATTSTNQIDYYGYAGHYSDVPATSGVFNLNWSDTYSGIYNFDVWVTEGTENNPFTLYWKQYLNEIYSDDARMLSAYFNLNSNDIHNLRFNNKIFVKDAFYRINSISGYKPNNTQPCKVELIKLGSDLAGLGNRCNLIIDSFNANGTVIFANAETGVATDATKDCCEAYGYTWEASGDGGSCFWKSPADNGDPFKPQDLTAPE